MASLERYKVPRGSVDVDALVERACHYLQVSAEDTEYLHYNATRRDKIIAELYARPGLKPFLSPAAFVPEGGDPDDHLVPADAAIAKLTPPKSLEDRVGRLHLVAAAMLVFEKYKVTLALADSPDLRREYRIKKAERRVFTVKSPCCSIFTLISAAVHPPSPPATPGSPRPMSREDIDCYLSNPNSLVGRRFVQSSQGDAEDEEEYGMWYVASYTVRVAEHGVENEYQVAAGALGGAQIPMGPAEIRHLLEHSVAAV